MLRFAMALALAAFLVGCGSPSPQDAAPDNEETLTEVTDVDVQEGEGEGSALTEETSSEESPEPTPAIYDYTTQEIWVDGRHGSIYGLAYVPEGEGPWPLVICAHGLGGTHSSVADYAAELATHGFMAYALDFNGGSSSSLSEGSTLDMSAQTEADDLEDVMDASAIWEFVDHERTYLMGESQGGLASAIAAARRPQEVDALCLFYPAFVLTDNLHEQFASLDKVPESYSMFGWITVGRAYAEDMWDFDFEREIAAYMGPVVIAHGTADSVVPYSYAERASAAYTNADLHLIDGAGHGFGGAAFDESLGYLLQLLDR